MTEWSDPGRAAWDRWSGPTRAAWDRVNAALRAVHEHRAANPGVLVLPAKLQAQVEQAHAEEEREAFAAKCRWEDAGHTWNAAKCRWED